MSTLEEKSRGWSGFRPGGHRSGHRLCPPFSGALSNILSALPDFEHPFAVTVDLFVLHDETSFGVFVC